MMASYGAAIVMDVDSVIEALDVAEKVIDGLPIPGLNPVISTIRTILQSGKVRIIVIGTMDRYYLW